MSNRPALLATVLITLTCGSCQTIREFTALERVDFALDRVENVRVAGVRLDGLRSFADVRPADVARVGLAVAAGELPLELDLVVQATNPADNPSQARLVRMAWTLLLEERETVSGELARDIVLPAGATTEIPLGMSLDLVEFFDGSARDLIELALSLTDRGGSPKTVALRATPVIETPLGPIQYPRPITIVRREVGGTDV
jgi:hypothetical protein